MRNLVDEHGLCSIGSVLGAEFALWDMGNVRGGKPFITVPTFPEGGNRFRLVSMFESSYPLTEIRCPS